MESTIYAVIKLASFLGAMVYTIASEIRFVERSGGSGEQDAESGNRLKRSVWGAIFLGWLLGMLPVGRWPSESIFWVGIGLMFGGLAFRHLAIRTLGASWSIYAASWEGQRLVAQGVYRYLRHPAYSGAMLWCVGIGLAYGNILSLSVMVLLPLIGGYLHRMAVEEAVLEQAWGDAYREYKRQTRRLIPFVW